MNYEGISSSLRPSAHPRYRSSVGVAHLDSEGLGWAEMTFLEALFVHEHTDLPRNRPSVHFCLPMLSWSWWYFQLESSRGLGVLPKLWSLDSPTEDILISLSMWRARCIMDIWRPIKLWPHVSPRVSLWAVWKEGTVPGGPGGKEEIKPQRSFCFHGGKRVTTQSLPFSSLEIHISGA